MARYETCLPANLEASRSARRFLRDALASRHLDDVETITELLTSELVTNVVCHVGSSVTVRLIAEHSFLRVEVDDTSTQVPVRHDQSAEEPSGNGLLLVDGLATRWGIDLRSDGKTVWFEIDISAAPRRRRARAPGRRGQQPRAGSTR